MYSNSKLSKPQTHPYNSRNFPLFYTKSKLFSYFIFTTIFFLNIISINSFPFSFFNRKSETTSTSTTESESKSSSIISPKRKLEVNVGHDLINNIVYFGQDYFFDASLNEEGDLFIEGNSNDQPTDHRYFYFLKSNGRSAFYNGENFTQFYDHNVNGLATRKDPINLIMKDSTTNEEYLVSINYREYETELFDYKNKKFYYYKTSQIFGHEPTPRRCALFQLKSSTINNYKYLYGFTYNSTDGEYFLVLKSFKILNKNLETSGSYQIVKEFDNKNDDTQLYTNIEMISCFETEKFYIVCFYAQFAERLPTVSVFNENLEKLFTEHIDDTPYKETNENCTECYRTFNKGIHVKDEIAAFLYFRKEKDTTPKIQILEIVDNPNFSIQNRLYTNIVEEDTNYIKLNKDGSQYPYFWCFYDDFIKLNDNNLVFISPSDKDGKKINIIFFELYNNYRNIRIKYYKYRANEKMGMTFKKSLRLFQFKGFLGFGFGQASGDKGKSGFILFSYCNCTDYEIEFNKFEGDSLLLSDYVFLENNLFDYYLDSVEIEKIFESETSGIKITKTEGGNDLIVGGDRISVGDSIYFSFLSMVYQNTFTLEFRGVVKENLTDVSDHIFMLIENDNGTDLYNYEPKTFYGRTGQINFTIISGGREEDGYFPLEGEGRFSNGQPAGYYFDTRDSSNKVYKKCHSLCSSCDEGPVEGNTKCTSCEGSGYELESNGNCKAKDTSIQEYEEVEEKEENEESKEINIIEEVQEIWEEEEKKENEESKEINQIEEVQEIWEEEEIEEFVELNEEFLEVEEIEQEEEKKEVNEVEEFSEYQEQEEVEEEFEDNDDCINKECSKCDEGGLLCLKCNAKEGYYKVEVISGGSIYYKCAKKEEKQVGYYFDEEKKGFFPCFETCKFCREWGDDSHHNCDECSFDFIPRPNEVNSKKCVPKCNYYYYINYFNQYKCTENFKCPGESPFLVKDFNECISSCKKHEINKFQLNDECVKVCPEGTENIDYICIINDNKCKVVKKYLDKNLYTDNYSDNNNDNSDFDYLAQEFIDQLVVNYENYQKENETSDIVLTYYNEEFSILIYQNYSCINEIETNTTKINFTSCYDLVQEKHNYQYGLIMVIINIYHKNQSPQSSFSFYSPKNYEEINIINICKEESFTVNVNITQLSLSSDTINQEELNFLLEQKIDVFNFSSPFFTDLCYHFESPKKKDVPLKDRLKMFYPNISLCDKGCINKGVDINTMEAKCECFLNSDIVSEAFGDETAIISEINLDVFKCYKDLKKVKYTLKNVGSLIVLSLVFLQSTFFIVSNFCGYYIKQEVIDKFFQNLQDDRNKQLNKENNDNINNDNNNNDNIDNDINEPPPKNKKEEGNNGGGNNEEGDNSQIINNNKNRDINKNKDINDTKSILNKSSNKKNYMKSVNNLFKKKSKNKSKSFFFNLDNYENNKNKNNNNKDSKTTLYSSKSKKNKNKYFQNENENLSNNNNNGINQVNKNILLNNEKSQLNLLFLDDLPYDDCLKYDKRTFCEFYYSQLLKSHYLFNTFCFKETFKPVSIKLVIFLLVLDLYFVANALFITEEYISELLNTKEDETFFSFVPRSIGRMIYCYITCSVIGVIIDCFFYEDVKIKKLLIIEKEKSTFDEKMKGFMMKQKKRCEVFLVVDYILMALSWYYIACFNNVYPYTKVEWVKSSVLLIIVTLLFSLVYALSITIIRFIGLNCKSERIFKFSESLRN